MKIPDITDVQRAYITDALKYKLDSVKRKRIATIPGTAIHTAHSETVTDLSNLISLFGG